jgi:hypothetical protein
MFVVGALFALCLHPLAGAAAPEVASPASAAPKPPVIGVVAMPLSPVKDSYAYLVRDGELDATARAFRDFTSTLSTAVLDRVKDRIADAFRARGMDVVMIPDTLDIEKYRQTRARDATHPAQNFRPVKSRYHVDRLVVLQFDRNDVLFSGTPELPTAAIHGVGYVVDLETNAYLRYTTVRVDRRVEDDWNDRSQFPGFPKVAAAWQRAVGDAADAMVTPLVP